MDYLKSIFKQKISSKTNGVMDVIVVENKNFY